MKPHFVVTISNHRYHKPIRTEILRILLEYYLLIVCILILCDL